MLIKMKKTTLTLMTCALCLGLTTSCVSNKKMIYLQGATQQYAVPQEIKDAFELEVQSDDQLAISVASKDVELLQRFNNNTLIGGADAIVMAGGIGENAAELREQIVKRLGALGVKLDKKANKAIRGGKSGLISTKDSKIPVIVIPTNEELMIARETVATLR